jgi:hypothetical protein
MYIIICTVYTTVQRRQTYTITIQNVYNYMFVYIVHTIIYMLYCYCICLSSLYRCIYGTYNYIHLALLLYMLVFSVVYINVYNYMYSIYNGTEKTNIYNNNTKCI